MTFIVDQSASHTTPRFNVASPTGAPLTDAAVTLQLPQTEAGGFDTAGNGLGNTGSTIFALDASLKWSILMGVQGTPGTVSLAGADRNYTPFTTATLNNGNPYYLTYGVQILSLIHI